MSKAERGTKHVCKSCGARFYDLNRDPVVCPVCAATFEAEVRSTVVEAVVAPEPAPPPPAPEAAPEEPEAKTAKAGEPEFISLEEADAEVEDDAGLPEIEDEIADIDDGEDVAADETDDSFLEAEDEDETDVSGIIGGPIKPEVEG